MNNLNWQKQSKNKALFEDIIWSKPQNKLSAGKYLIIGGNVHELIKSAIIYDSFMKVGASNIRLAMPIAVRKLIKDRSLNIDFLPSTPSGSFSLQATAEILDLAKLSDIAIISSDISKNSETTLMQEHFINNYHKKVCLLSDNIAIFDQFEIDKIDYNEILLIGEVKHLQKLLINKFNVLIKESDELYLTVKALSDLTQKIPIKIVTLKNNMILVASAAKVCSTEVDRKINNWIEEICGPACFYLINNSDPYKALCSAVYEFLYHPLGLKD